MAKQAERTATTQAKILRVAQEVFARDGYAKAALAEIVELSGVTTGAIYHHFGGKKELFIAVAKQVEQYIVDQGAAAAPAKGTKWERFEASIGNTLEICARPDIQRIVFRDAPTVVGFFEWREIEIQYGFGQMQKAIALLASEGIIDAPNPDLTAQILLGAIMEAAHFAAISKNKKTAVKQGKATINKLLQALLVEK
ncbi:MAG: TetR family transcriptional regulator [Pseudohongiella sp.]|nr:MAG: TetR family transcriptional regulator [Pseudohongiella sp.]